MRLTILTLLTAIALTSLSCSAGERAEEKIIIATPLGDIHVTLDPVNAPLTTANFLRYVDAGLLDGTCFYRVVRPDNQPDNPVIIEVIQGGRYQDEESGGFEPVAHETTAVTGIRHLDGTISMARYGPGTATSEFFICVGDQPELDHGGKRNPDGEGFAAFGRVTRGMEVVRMIHATVAPEQYLDQPVVITTISRVKK